MNTSANIAPFGLNFLSSHFAIWQTALNAKEICTIHCIPVSGRDYQSLYFNNWQRANDYPQAVPINLVSDRITEPSDFDRFFKLKQPLIIYPGEIFNHPDQAYLEQALIEKHLKNQVGLIIFRDLDSSFNPDLHHHLIQHLDYMPLFPKDVSYEFMEYLAKRWNLHINQATLAQFYQHTGGHTWLMIQLIRQFLQIQENETNPLKHSLYQHRIHRLWQLLPPPFQSALIKASQHQINTHDPVVQHLKQLGFISEVFNNQIPQALFEYIQNHSPYKIQIFRSKIIINEVNVSNHFSYKERRILYELWQNQNKPVNRERISEVYWQDQAEEQYSDWAIDQTISRLRKKFIKLGVSSDLIITIRNIGYQFSYHE